MRTKTIKLRDRIINFLVMDEEIYEEIFQKEEFSMDEVREICEIFDISIPSFYRIVDSSPLLEKKPYLEKKGREINK